MEPKFMSPNFCFISLKLEARIEYPMKKTLSTVLLGFLLVTTSFIIFAPAVRANVAYTVQVGYADDLRAAPNFPSPWCGSPNVALFASVGDSVCAGSGPTWDDGAILITNTGSSSFTINSLTVLEPNDWCGSGGCTIWGGYLPFILYRASRQYSPKRADRTSTPATSDFLGSDLH